jgi:hypothetical protein
LSLHDLVDGHFGEKAQLEPSLGKESHRLDVMVHTPNDYCSLWRLERHLIGPLLSIQHPNTFSLEARELHLEA